METLDKPVWLLDVNGVIFPESSKPGWRAAPRKVYIPISDGRILRERYSIQLVREIRDIIKSQVVEVIWSTTWVNDNDVERLEHLFSFPPLKRAFSSCSIGGLHEKTDVARRVVRSGRRLVWTDDNVVPQWGPLYDELTKNNRSLLITPDSKKGLQPEDLMIIRNYVGIKSVLM